MVYSGGPYIDIGSITIDGDDDEIGPLNIPYSRVSDGIQLIIEKTITSSFIPYEWWLDYAGSFYVAETRGSDKSASVHLVAGDHIAGSVKEQVTKQTSQRVRVVGRGETAEQDNNTSDWQEDTGEMDTINGFYEKVESEKSLSSKDESDTWAQVLLALNAPVRNEITIKLENDQYNAGHYDVGDTVTATDPDTGIAGTYRVKTIEKRINNNGGESVSVTLCKRRTDIIDRLSDLFKRMQKMENSSTYLDSMFAEGSRQTKLKDDVVEDIWGQTASNKWAIEVPEDKNEDDTYLQECDPHTRIDYDCTKDIFEVYGTASDAIGWVYLWGTDNTGDPLLNFGRDPRFTCEFEIDTSGDRTEWNNASQIQIGIRSIYDPTNPTSCGNWGFIGFGFRIYKSVGFLELQAKLYTDAGYIKEVKIANLSYDEKYIVEARVEWKEKVIKYYFGKSDVDDDNLEWGFRLRAILPIPYDFQDKYEFSGTDYYNYLCPFHVVLWGQGTSPYDPEKPAIVIFRWKTQAIRAVKG